MQPAAMAMTDTFTEPTTDYWQQLHETLPPEARAAPFRYAYPVELPDGRWLKLPIRQRQDKDRAVASFIANHASLSVLDALAAFMADQTREARPDIVVGLPTLGLALAAPLARLLGHDRFVPFGTSRKYWYDDSLSEDAHSITTTASRKLYVDPNLVPLLNGRRVLLVDDTISTGTTAVAALGVLAKAGADVAGLAFAMSQGKQWRSELEARAPWAVPRVSFVFQTPHFTRTERGWMPLPL